MMTKVITKSAVAGDALKNKQRLYEFLRPKYVSNGYQKQKLATSLPDYQDFDFDQTDTRIIFNIVTFLNVCMRIK